MTTAQNNNYNVTKIHPMMTTTSNALLQGNLRNDTPLRITNNPTQDPASAAILGNNNNGMYASGYTGQAGGNTPAIIIASNQLIPAPFPTGNRRAAGANEELIIDTNTNMNVGHTHAQLSPTSNKSFLKLSGYAAIEQLKKFIFHQIEAIHNSRLVEVLGGLASTSAKVRAIEGFGSLWQDMLTAYLKIEEKILLMTFEQDILYQNSQQYISDLIVTTVKELEAKYLTLISSSSLRFLDTVCTTHDLQYKQYINLKYDVRSWRKSNLDHVKSSQPMVRKNGRVYDKDGNLVLAPKNKSFMASICPCLSGGNTANSNSNNNTVKNSQSFLKSSSQMIKR